MTSTFNHIQSAHCENGVTSNLLNHHGVTNIDEPLAFGIGSGLFFIYVPFLTFSNGPAIAFRTLPGKIFARTCKLLDIPIYSKRFSSPKKAKEYLDDFLNQNKFVGVQVGVFYLPYFPKEYRFHFNAHNIIVYGKENGNYLVSDPVMETTTSLSSEELERVRFSKGVFAPQGYMYFPKNKTEVTTEQVKKAIILGIRRNARDMLYLPGGIAGVSGINFMGRRIKKWRDKLGLRKAGLNLANLVRMQEEIGTGGGGFRYIYAAFLQKAYTFYPAHDELLKVADLLTKSGDLWRDSAVQASGMYKGRITEQVDFDTMGDYLLEIADIEKKAFKSLREIQWKK